MDTKQFRPGLNISSLCYFLTQCRFPKKRHNGTVSFSRCKLDAPGSRKIGIFRFSLLFSNKLEVALINFRFEDFYYYVRFLFLLLQLFMIQHVPMFQCNGRTLFMQNYSFQIKSRPVQLPVPKLLPLFSVQLSMTIFSVLFCNPVLFLFLCLCGYIL